MDFVFHPEAEVDFLEAINYYEGCAQGLGLDFSLEVYTSIQLITQHPRAWTTHEGDIRRCLIHRFPFGILYSIENQSILILAVMNLRQEPGYWKSRTQN